MWAWAWAGSDFFVIADSGPGLSLHIGAKSRVLLAKWSKVCRCWASAWSPFPFPGCFCVFFQFFRKFYRFYDDVGLACVGTVGCVGGPGQPVGSVCTDA